MCVRYLPLPSLFFFLSLSCFLLSPLSPKQSGQFNEDMIPTVGFNMRKVTKGNVTIKVSACALSVYSVLTKQWMVIDCAMLSVFSMPTCTCIFPQHVSCMH